MNVIFGAGPVGQSVAQALIEDGETPVFVNRSGKSAMTGVSAVAADAANVESAIASARGARTIFFCLNAPYTDWPTLFPPLQAGVLAAAKAHRARLVVLENLYGYGDQGGAPLIETMPMTATGRKGRTRAAMSEALFQAHRAGDVEVVIGRASDFYGPRVTDSALGSHAVGALARGRPAMTMGDPDTLHSYSYMPDIGRNLVTLSRATDAFGKAWHLPNAAPMTTRDVLSQIAEALGVRLRLKTMGRLSLHAIGLAVPALRELQETYHQFAKPWIVEDGAFRGAFAAKVTPVQEAARATAAWNRERAALGR
jgi:nucleoside-diphosphate-sugar epimerase